MPGYYWVTIRTIPGEKAVFHDRDVPDFSYEITMREYEFRVHVLVRIPPEPQIFLNLQKNVIMDNEETIASFYGNVATDMTGAKVTADPEGIVEIGEFALPYPELGDTVFQVPKATIKARKPGIVTLTGTADGGLTTSVTLEVIDHTNYLNGAYGGDGSTFETFFYSETDQKAEFTIADESIARIAEIGEFGRNIAHKQPIRLELLKPGETTLTAVTPDGKTAVCKITVVSSETTPAISEAIPTCDTTNLTAANAKKGDVNADRTIDIMDVIRLNKSLLGIEKLTNEQSAAADVDGSGKVDSNDSLLILKYALEMIDRFNA